MNFDNSKLFNALAAGGVPMNIGNRHRWWVMNPTTSAISPTITFEGAAASQADHCAADVFSPLMIKDSCNSSDLPVAASYTFRVDDPIPPNQARAIQFNPHNGIPAFARAAVTAGAIVWLEISGLA